jgi:hypothetical protein
MRSILVFVCATALTGLLGAGSASAAGKVEPGQCKANADCEAPEICFRGTKTCAAPCEIDCVKEKPVCGKDGVTYPCGKYEALCHGTKPKHRGTCKDACLCPDVYEPVCGADGATYGNRCEAHCAGVEIVAKGACDEPACDGNEDCAKPEICFPPTKECQLPCDVHCDEAKPVCGKDGVTYRCGEADAFCHGVRVAHPGVCKDGCVCPEVWEPVCGSDGKTYANACKAECAGVRHEPGACEEPCVCPEIYAPVCGNDGVTYPNACVAECADVHIVHEGECRAPCLCPGVWDPVCGEDHETYGNQCEAVCVGVHVLYEGECDDPVCPEVCRDDEERVVICHHPPGTPRSPHTIVVGESAVAAHVRSHGDTLGACEEGDD